MARWWPGDPDGAWRGGRHDLNADWSLDLTLPQRTARMSTLQWIQSLQGVGELKVGESAWAGVPLTGRLQFGQGGARARPDRSSVEGELRIGGNQLQVQGQADTGGSGEDDRWELSLDAPAVRDIAPLTALHPSLAAWSPRGGRLKATLSARGRWPRLVSHGAVEAEGLTAGVLSLERGRVTWRADSIDRQTGELQLELAQAQWSHTRLDRLQARLDGTFARHRAQLSWQAPTPLPPRMVQVLGGVEADRSRGELSVEGSWSAEADGSGQWRGQLHQVSAVAMPAGNVTAPPPWLEARDIPARADFSPGGRLSELRIGAGRVRLGPSLRLRWDDISYRLTGERRDVDLDFEIEPTEVNPLLQRANTGLNWAGDLRMSLRGRIRAAQDVRADIELRRLGGDLLVGDEGDRKALGLTQAGLTLSVERGVWRVAPLLAGTQLGTISGNLELRTSPEARWPDNEAALSGAVQAQVIDLSIWSAWVPPGWGLSGRVATTASLAGRLGAPELVGELQASEIGVRNLLQGVSFRDGRARIALRGDRAQIEQLELRGGDGSLRVSGDADIGAQPRARLRLDARQLTVLGRINRQLTVSGEGAVDLRADRLDLRGRFAVDRGLIDLGTPEIPTLDADVVVGPSAAAPSADPPVGPAATPSVAPPIAPGPWIRGSTAALDIDLGRQLRVRGRGVDTPLQGQLKVGVQDGRLAVNGTVDARGGTYAAYGQKLEIDRGRVLFAGSPDNPRLDLLALRPQTDMRVGVAIVGTAQNPRVRLYSDPEMSERDKLSWLVLGRGAEGLGRTDTTMLQRAAVALLSGEQEAPTDALLKALGIDELTFSQTDGDVRDTVVGLGKQLGRNWYLGYERGVNATAGTWQLVYRLARQFTLRARSGEDASMDLVWTWRFDRPREIGAAMRGRPPAETQESTDTGSAAPTGPFPGSGSPRPDKR
jgi:translocation and assembly module TamB